jgi:hypothetical protein
MRHVRLMSTSCAELSPTEKLDAWPYLGPGVATETRHGRHAWGSMGGLGSTLLARARHPQPDARGARDP